MKQPIVILIAVLMVALALGSLWVRSLYGDIGKLEAKVEAVEVERDKALATVKQCERDKTITSEASNEFQKDLSSVRRQLADLKRVRSNPRCIPVTR